MLETLNGYANRHDALFEDPLRFMTLQAPVLFILLLGALFLAHGKLGSRNARHGVVAAGFSAGLALGIAQIANHLWARPRPYVAHPGDVHLFIPASLDTSFPSDHAAAAFAIAVAMAALVSMSRVAVGTHYPTDVLAGAAIGTLSALVFYHPLVRRPLHALADRVGALYEGLVVRRPQTS